MTPIRIAALCLIAAAALAQGQIDPAYESLSKAFDALRTYDYDGAISFFEKAAELAPDRADIRKNMGYTLLKTGDSETAREEFGAAMRLEPSDVHVALEYAFLCFEARDNAPARKAEARRIFARVRDSADADAALRETASQAFQNIDAPLAAGIARWQHVLATSPPTFSALHELANSPSSAMNSILRPRITRRRSGFCPRVNPFCSNSRGWRNPAAIPKA